MLTTKAIAHNNPAANAEHDSFKESDAGLIPADWEADTFGSVITELRGGAPLKPSDFVKTGVKVLPKGGVGRTGWLDIDDEDLQFCSQSYANIHINNQVDASFTIVVLRDLVPSGPSIGLMVQINSPETFVLAQGVYGFKVNERAVPEYLVHLSNTSWYRKLANSIMVGSTQVHITNTALKRAIIPLPPPPEQQAIAEVLSDADALIESLEQLITKKRQIKQGAMQDLLTGKKRLAGFLGDLVFEPLGDLARLYQPQTISANALSDWGYPVYGANGVVGYYHSFNHELPQVAVTCRGSTCGTVNKTSSYSWITGNSMVINCDQNPKLDKDYLFYALSYGDLSVCITGSGLPQIVRGPLSMFKIWKPELAEQKAISAILNEMDNEIASVESKIEKAKQVKQGMMQDLLTGKVRLV